MSREDGDSLQLSGGRSLIDNNAHFLGVASTCDGRRPAIRTGLLPSVCNDAGRIQIATGRNSYHCSCSVCAHRLVSQGGFRGLSTVYGGATTAIWSRHCRAQQEGVRTCTCKTRACLPHRADYRPQTEVLNLHRQHGGGRKSDIWARGAFAQDRGAGCQSEAVPVEGELSAVRGDAFAHNVQRDLVATRKSARKSSPNPGGHVNATPL